MREFTRDVILAQIGHMWFNEPVVGYLFAPLLLRVSFVEPTTNHLCRHRDEIGWPWQVNRLQWFWALEGLEQLKLTEQVDLSIGEVNVLHSSLGH